MMRQATFIIPMLQRGNSARDAPASCRRSGKTARYHAGAWNDSSVLNCGCGENVGANSFAQFWAGLCEWIRTYAYRSHAFGDFSYTHKKTRQGRVDGVRLDGYFRKRYRAYTPPTIKIVMTTMLPHAAGLFIIRSIEHLSSTGLCQRPGDNLSVHRH